ncbi:MAG: succinate dehydrogenase cytochrome b subunit [Opitutaceae bacterium]
MNFFFGFYQSSIGKKWVVALTGLVLIGYVIGHLVGNLQIFGSPEKINSYASFLHSLGALLWVVRVGLLVCFVLHIVTTIKLVVENRAARPERYVRKATVQARLAARTMALSGLLVLSFVVYHLLHFTVRSTDARFRPIADGGLLRGEFDVHTMVILSFQHPLVSGVYLLSVFLLCLHLSHGFSSLLQTFGLNSKGLMAAITRWGTVLAWVIFAGYASIPVAVLAGFLKVQP